jgi:hypothetical protein
MATLGELMHDTFVTVAPEDTIGEAAQKMVEAGAVRPPSPTSGG